MKDEKKVCDLCGLTVEIDDFHLHTIEGDKQFCCEGCQGIYQMLHEDIIVEEKTDSKD